MSYSNGLLPSNINNISTVKGPKGDDGVGFLLTSSGDYDMDGKILFNARANVDANEDDAYDTIKKNYQSVPNKEYLNNHFLKRDKTGVFYDLRGLSIQNSEDFDQNSSNNKTLINKGYVDSSIHHANTMNRDHIETVKAEVDLKLANKADLTINNEQTFKSIINVPDFDPGYSNMTNVMNKGYIDSRDALKADKSYADSTYLTKTTGAVLANSIQKKADIDDVMTLDGRNHMNANLNLNDYKITNLKAPTNDTDAVNKEYIDFQISNVRFSD